MADDRDPTVSAADPTTTDNFGQFMTALLESNSKAAFETWLRQQEALTNQHIRDVDREREQRNDWAALALEQARQNQQIVNRLAQDGATISARVASNAATIDARLASAAATLDAVVGANAITANEAAQAADNRMMTDLANKFQNEAKEAIQAAVAAAVQSNPVNQGSTGTAQAGMQLDQSVAISALMAQMTKLAEGMTYLTQVVMADTADRKVAVAGEVKS